VVLETHHRQLLLKVMLEVMVLEAIRVIMEVAAAERVLSV
jgi:hypothetical protein